MAGRGGDDGVMGTTSIIDLSHIIADGTITYPGLPAPVISDHLTREASRDRYAPSYEFRVETSRSPTEDDFHSRFGAKPGQIGCGNRCFGRASGGGGEFVGEVVEDDLGAHLAVHGRAVA